MKKKSTTREAASLWNMAVKSTVKAVNGEYTDAQHQAQITKFKKRLDAIIAKHALPNP